MGRVRRFSQDLSDLPIAWAARPTQAEAEDRRRAEKLIQLICFDAFGNDRQAECLAHADDDLRDRAVFRILWQFANERSSLIVSTGNCFMADIDE